MRVEPSGRRKTTVPAASSTKAALPSGLHGGDGWALALEDRLDAVERIEREQLVRGRVGGRPSTPRRRRGRRRRRRGPRRRTVDAHAARLTEAHGAVVDELDQALRAVVDDDDVAGLVDVVVGARVGGADCCRHLADDAVDVADVADVALEQPGAAVVGVGVRLLPAIGEQRGDDDRRDDRGEHGEHAAGDAPPGARVTQPAASLVSSLLVFAPQLHRSDGATEGRTGHLVRLRSPPPPGTTDRRLTLVS